MGDFVGPFVGGDMVGVVDTGAWVELLDGAFVGGSLDSHTGILTFSTEVVLPSEVDNITLPWESMKDILALLIRPKQLFGSDSLLQ